MRYISSSALTALAAATSSVLCVWAAIPVWTMFIGWIAFVAGGMTTKTAAPTFVCALGGLLLGVAGSEMIRVITSQSSDYIAIFLAVFLIVFPALLSAKLPIANVVIGYFIGMTTFFASALPIGWPTVITLASGLLAGIISGLLAVALATKIMPVLEESAAS